VASLGKISQCSDKKTATTPSKAPTPRGGPPQSASRERFTQMKKARLPTLLPLRPESFKLGCIGSNSFDAGATGFFCFLISSKNRESALNLGDEILVRGGVL
jgi:hypothetical protein